MVSLVGSEAVKYCGSGFGNAGAATGAGAAGVCAGAAGTCVCAEALIRNRDIATSTAALANRTDGRIKLFLLISRESSQILGSVIQPQVSTLRAKIRPDEAEPEGCGGSTVEGENEEWPDFRSSPKGRGQFSPALRPSSLGYARYPSLLIPRSEKKWLPSPPTGVV